MKTDNGVYIPPQWYRDTFEIGPYSPRKGESYVDPVFGETVRRVTDAVADGNGGYSCEYATLNLINSDATLIRVATGTGQGNFVIDLATGDPVRKVTSSISASGAFWHPTDPKLLYVLGGPSEKTLKLQDVTTGQVEVIWDYDGLYNVLNTGEGQLSLDGRRLGFAHRVGGQSVGLVVFDVVDRRVVSYFDYEEARLLGYPVFDAHVAECGDIIKCQGSKITTAWNVNASAPGQSPGQATLRWDNYGNGGGHSDTCVAPDGKCYKIGFNNNGQGTISRWNLTDGGPQEVLYVNGWMPNSDPRGPEGWEHHFCCNAVHETGYVYWTITPGQRDGDPAYGWKKYMGEVARFPWNGGLLGGGPVERIAHNRAMPIYPDPTTGVPRKWYWPQVKGGPDPKGRYFIFGSNMRKPDNGSDPRFYNDIYGIDLTTLGGNPTMSELTDRKTILEREGKVVTVTPGSPPTGGTPTTIQYQDRDGQPVTEFYDPTTEQWQDIDV